MPGAGLGRTGNLELGWLGSKLSREDLWVAHLYRAPGLWAKGHALGGPWGELQYLRLDSGIGSSCEETTWVCPGPRAHPI